MTDPASSPDALDDDADARAIARARAEIADGRGVPHERVRAWLLRLADGEDVEPPSA